MKRKSCPYGPTNDYVLSSPIGQLAVKSCPHGLHSLHQVEGIDDATFAPDPRVLHGVGVADFVRRGPGRDDGELCAAGQDVQQPTGLPGRGAAMRRNPLQLLVPCHRVVRQDGTLGHYSGGKRDRVKRWLLSHEGCLTDNL
ncbi:hypothetical protein HPB48_005795 [Haemaphysalis longicornis]|uniref:Methylated-DNA--protein-cysteine methyltransferase n=1 Tax=Haemaphysalis longicornis TaxID=44386 RepID=A0A9J6FRZ0_HAELO|nr:hypothetical protein HPB48_005795 [Haemaphysalis longicornis]